MAKKLKSKKATEPENGKKSEIKKKKPEPAQVSAGDVRFGSYIAKLHKAMQNEPDHDQRRTITADAVTSIENMTDHFVNSCMDNAKNVMQYTKASTFGIESARAAVALGLQGALKKAASKAGDDAVEKYVATLPPPKAAAAETEPVTASD
jgi:hypothetical protein